MRPQFAREQVSDLQLEELHVQNMMRALDFTKQPNKWTDTVDLQVLFFRLTLDSATEFLFGQSVDSQIALAPGYKKTAQTSVADANSVDFATAFDKGQMGLAVSSFRKGPGLHMLIIFRHGPDSWTVRILFFPYVSRQEYFSVFS